MQACGVTGAATDPNARRQSVGAHAKKKFSVGEVGTHLRGLFETKKIGLSTSLIWFSWLLIGECVLSPGSRFVARDEMDEAYHKTGLAYPLYNVFLPQYLESRGAETGDDSPSTTWRNYTLVSKIVVKTTP